MYGFSIMLQLQQVFTNTAPSYFMLAAALGIGGVAFLLIIRFYVKDPPYFIPGFPKLSSDYRKILQKHSNYYLRLSPGHKLKFEKRVYSFISIKVFIPRKMKKVTLEMKTMIAASAVQLTFGFDGLNMPHFKRILIYPDAYYSRIRKTYHKGEVNPAAQLIVFSWKDFAKDFGNREASNNLGLHEMAHALKLENNVFKNEMVFLDPALYRKWEAMAAQNIARLKTEEDLLFRQYAGENEYEFFAVAVENFFERPFAFQTIHPEIYEVLKGLLKQDPIAIQQLDPEAIEKQL